MKYFIDSGTNTSEMAESHPPTLFPPLESGPKTSTAPSNASTFTDLEKQNVEASRASSPAVGDTSDYEAPPSDIEKLKTQEINGDPSQGGGDLQRIESSPYPNTLKLIIIMLAVALCIFLAALDMTIVATAIPRITDEFQSLEDVGWYGSAFFLTLAAFQSTWGKAYKYFDLKWAFLVSVAIFEVGSLICGMRYHKPLLLLHKVP